MSQCPKCGKPVFFAERRTSLGKDWHPQCLKCEECGRVLHPGQHSEHRGVPYCSVPCYSVLFGPIMFGHGSPIGAHKSFGRPADKDSSKKGPDIIMIMTKLKTYNDFYEGKSGQLASKEVNDRLVLEGVLRVYWGVEKPIQLKPKDDVPVPRSWRRSYIMAMNNGLDDELLQKIGVENDPVIRRRRSSLEDLVESLNSNGERQQKYNTVSFRGELSRRKRFSINGHCYNLETSVFTPVHGTITSVRVTSLTPAPEVIKLLLDKFKVENNPEEFCLNAIRRNGESKVLRESDYPLLERVLMGPMEDEAQIFIMEKSRVQDVSQDVAQYVLLPEPVLCGFLEKYKQEEDTEVKKIKQKYEEYRYLLNEQFSSMATQM